MGDAVTMPKAARCICGHWRRWHRSVIRSADPRLLSRCTVWFCRCDGYIEEEQPELIDIDERADEGNTTPPSLEERDAL